MKIKLTRYTFPDDESWELVGKDIPLGTPYELLDVSVLSIYNVISKKQRVCACYLVRRDKYEGWMPACLFGVLNG